MKFSRRKIINNLVNSLWVLPLSAPLGLIKLDQLQSEQIPFSKAAEFWRRTKGLSCLKLFNTILPQMLEKRLSSPEDIRAAQAQLGPDYMNKIVEMHVSQSTQNLINSLSPDESRLLSSLLNSNDGRAEALSGLVDKILQSRIQYLHETSTVINSDVDALVLEKTNLANRNKS